ncbi:hypothetical protein VNO80_19044 [Phaseolus coccineus]|uniref:Uncharacterized protein n=1 Tax=Phaseolus coccineus TaxID=3886 RepID=A0AAN9MFC7_PHACN
MGSMGVELEGVIIKGLELDKKLGVGGDIGWALSEWVEFCVVNSVGMWRENGSGVVEVVRGGDFVAVQQRISKCKTAKEMWETLKVALEPKEAMAKSQARRKKRQNKKNLNLCLMARREDDSCSEILEERKQLWYLDSGCSKRMTRDKSKFLRISFK